MNLFAVDVPGGNLHEKIGNTIENELNYELYYKLYNEKQNIFPHGFRNFKTSMVDICHSSLPHEYMIFEGAQGVLLDMEHGFFPHVTRSKTTVTNALKLIKNTEDYDLTVVTRTYQTRHGNGFMTNENAKLPLKNNENETNVSHKFQGEFRIGEIDFELLNYSMHSLFTDIDTRLPRRLNLMITCNDQFEVNIDNFILSLKHFKFDDVFLSYGPDPKDVIDFYKFKNCQK